MRRALFWILLLLAFGGCGEQQQAGPRPPVPFHDGDECHVCGMLIARFPGPKGEAWVRGGARPLKFCSTRELFGWLLQPDSAAVAEAVYVHDMAQNDWQHPDDTRLIDARSAWYVAGSRLQGAMGPTLASFARREDAEAFAGRHGGRIIRYQDITLDLLVNLD